MTWVPLLLADPSPCLRWLVLRDLLHRPGDDHELAELASLRTDDPLIADLVSRQHADGSWQAGDPAWMGQGSRIQATALALHRLGYLGLTGSFPAVQRGAEFLFSLQRADGAWPQSDEDEVEESDRGYSMRPLQTSLPLRGLAACGYSTDPRAEHAYEWLLAQRLEDGAWPTGISAGTYGRVAGYSRLAHSRWGYRSNTTGALLCLALHPARCTSPAAQRALDLLLGRETQEAHTLGYDSARLLGFEPAHGFTTFYARYDLAQILDLAGRVGATLADERVAGMLAFVNGLQNPYGLWSYPARPQANRWVTFDLLRSLSRLKEEGNWFSFEPRTPFRAYPRQKQRY
ncbi:MAG: hypothetical protein ACYC6L_08430 [Anaerolineae bacterium]